MARPSVEQAMTLAPDAPSLKDGQKLATAAPWSDTGCDDRAVWGACRGSGKAPYRVMVDTVGPAYKCSCPSRKFPCKHAIGLLLLWAERSPVVVEGTPPPDTAAWLASRTARDAKGTIAGAVAGKDAPTVQPEAQEPGAQEAQAQEPAARVADPEAAAARIVQRAGNITAGMAELDRWLGDLARSGFGSIAGQPYAFFDDMGARLVDAQAPGAAERVRGLAEVVHSGDGWPSRLLSEVARLHLLAAGWARYDTLPEQTRADLRTAAGWPWPSEAVLAGRREADRWYVLARGVTEERTAGRVVVQTARTWLWGLETKRLGVVVDFARPGAAFSWELWPGNVVAAEAARFPGSAPLRVLVASRQGDAEPGGPPPAWADFAAMADERSRSVATDPWIDRWPVSVSEVVPERSRDGFEVFDRDGRRLELAAAGGRGWKLLALSAGRPVTLLGEWSAPGICPLGVWTEDRMVVL